MKTQPFKSGFSRSSSSFQPVGALAQRGQGMTEYIIIVALIAVAAIGVYSMLGQTIRNQTAGIALEISGKDGADGISNAGKIADEAKTKANNAKGLSNYNADQNRAGEK